MTSTSTPPNHHAHFGSFHGVSGLVAALSMVAGREGDASIAVELTDLQAGDRLVDVGCGPGVAIRRAARLGATAVGVDPAPVMRRVANLLNLPPFGPGRRVEVVDGVAEHLPASDASATVMWSIATVHHWRDLDAGLAEARRVLQPSGRFLAIERRTEPGAHGLASHGWTDDQAEDFAALLTRAGFVGAEVVRREAGRRSLIAVMAKRGA